MNVNQLKAHCAAQFQNESLEWDQRNAYDEITRHIEEHKTASKEGLALDLAYKAMDYQQRAEQIRQGGVGTAVADTLSTKADVYIEMGKKLS